MLLIKNGRVVDPVTKTDCIMDVLVDDGKIIDVCKGISEDDFKDARVIDATGLVVAPGLVDTHVHFRDPGFTYKEDIFTGSRAALKGGFTTVVCMANTKPAVDNLETLNYIQEKGEKTGLHIMQTATVSKGLKGQELVDMSALARSGACGFTDDGIPLMDEKLLLKAMTNAKELDLPISLHEEDPAFIVAPGVHQGQVSKQLEYGGASRTAEDVMVARDCILALHTGASVCIQHISSKNSVELVRLAKRLGADIHAEATPHHFTLTDEAVLKYGTYARMNPPLRTEQDRLAIIEGLKDGTIDMIVTDHAPHSVEEKAKPLISAPSGITGLETSLALGIHSLVKPGHISLMDLMALMSKNPMEFYRIVPEGITKGAVADLVIFGEDEMWKVDNYASKAVNSPFTGWELPGCVHYTICSGRIAYDINDKDKLKFVELLGQTGLFEKYQFIKDEDFLQCRVLIVPDKWTGDDIDRVKAACEFAMEAHKDQTRKGTDTPYIVHPVETATIALDMTDDVDVVIGAFLHDVVEDTNYTLNDISARFGAHVADLVKCESEDKRRDLPPEESWKMRKQGFLNRLKKTNRDEKIISLADKLSNLRSMYKDYLSLGDELWSRFNQKDKKEHLWYYNSVAELIKELKCQDSYKEYVKLCKKVFED